MTIKEVVVIVMHFIARNIWTVHGNSIEGHGNFLAFYVIILQPIFNVSISESF